MSTNSAQGHGQTASIRQATPDAVPGKKSSGAVSAILDLTEDDDSTVADDLVVDSRPDEHFLPVTRYALIERLTRPQAWAPGIAKDAQRFFRFLDYWRQQQHAMRLMRLVEAYEPFSPDSDLFVTRQYTDAERRDMQARVVSGVTYLVQQANYKIVPREKVEATILSQESHYGLDLKVDFDAFEELIVCYRGESTTKVKRRNAKRFFRKEAFSVPIFRRMLVMFKLKSVERHIEDVRRHLDLSQQDAAKHVRRSRGHIPEQIKADNIYIKIFKNIPKSDVEMVFPNTQVKFRTKDKVWLGVTGSAAVGAGVVGAADKLALAFSNSITAAGAVGGLGLVMFRQVMNFMNQKQRYMQVLAQNLYFHAMADNRGAMTKLADRAAEEDFKEEILLYSVLAKEPVRRSELDEVDKAIQAYVERTFGLQVDFDLQDALERLMVDGLVSEGPDGVLSALSPKAAADHIDSMWDQILDMLPEDSEMTGREIDRTLNGPELSHINGKAGAA